VNLTKGQRLALLAGGVALVTLVLLGSRKALAYVQGKATDVKLAPIPGGGQLREDAAEAFRAMHAAAAAESVTLVVNSSFRSMEAQERLYAEYQAGTGNLAARPGYSNHQGGIAVDIQTGGTGTKVYAWLDRNAARYGFKRTVASEPWHWEFRPRETGAGK